MQRRPATLALALLAVSFAAASGAEHDGALPSNAATAVTADERGGSGTDDLVGTRITVHDVSPQPARAGETAPLFVQGDNERVLRSYGLAPRVARLDGRQRLLDVGAPLFEALKSYQGFIVRYELLAPSEATTRGLRVVGTTDLDCTVVQVEPGLAGGARIVCVVDSIGH